MKKQMSVIHEEERTPSDSYHNMAILFWFYKEVEICENRLLLLKKFNPNLKIFGLYGGDKNKAKEFKHQLAKYLDDFYLSPFEDPNWKWINGDLMILDWYKNRGVSLNWNSLVIIQWDTLVFDSLLNQFSGIKENEIFLSGVRTINKEIEEKWDWVKYGSQERKNYLSFLSYVKENYNFNNLPLASLFILQVFPRIFFEEYMKVENKKVGMLEYKIPIYAKIFSIPFYEKDLGTLWFSRKMKPLNAEPKEIPESYIKDQLLKKNGWRIFHPFSEHWDLENIIKFGHLMSK